MRILCVDPGERRLGIALSDPTGTIASPLTVIAHVARDEDATRIVEMAAEQGAEKIVVGQATDEDGKPTVQGRGAARLAAALRTKTVLPVELWDESYSTRDAKRVSLEMGRPQQKRRGHLDEMAAAIILQSYLDSHPEESE